MFEKVKQGVWPFLIGLVLGLLIMPFGFGFVSESTATENAQTAALDAATKTTLSLQVPLCVTKAQTEPEKLAEVMASPSYKHDDGVKDAGWATYPAEADREVKAALDDACAEALEKL